MLCDKPEKFSRDGTKTESFSSEKLISRKNNNQSESSNFLGLNLDRDIADLLDDEYDNPKPVNNNNNARNEMTPRPNEVPQQNQNNAGQQSDNRNSAGLGAIGSGSQPQQPNVQAQPLSSGVSAFFDSARNKGNGSAFGNQQAPSNSQFESFFNQGAPQQQQPPKDPAVRQQQQQQQQQQQRYHQSGQMPNTIGQPIGQRPVQNAGAIGPGVPLTSPPAHHQNTSNFQPVQEPSPILMPNHSQPFWFYKDPTGIKRGPFKSEEMIEWFKSEYFKPDLLVRRACDVPDDFIPLGEMIKIYGLPFNPRARSCFDVPAGAPLPMRRRQPHPQSQFGAGYNDNRARNISGQNVMQQQQQQLRMDPAIQQQQHQINQQTNGIFSGQPAQQISPKTQQMFQDPSIQQINRNHNQQRMPQTQFPSQNPNQNISNNNNRTMQMTQNQQSPDQQQQVLEQQKQQQQQRERQASAQQRAQVEAQQRAHAEQQIREAEAAKKLQQEEMERKKRLAEQEEKARIEKIAADKRMHEEFLRKQEMEKQRAEMERRQRDQMAAQRQNQRVIFGVGGYDSNVVVFYLSYLLNYLFSYSC